MRAVVSSGAVVADEGVGVGELGAVVEQEASVAGELVVLHGHDLDGELDVGQVGARELECLSGFGLVLVDLPGLGVVALRLQRLEALLGLLLGVAGAS